MMDKWVIADLVWAAVFMALAVTWSGWFAIIAVLWSAAALARVRFNRRKRIEYLDGCRNHNRREVTRQGHGLTLDD
jgi:hypothetical protein